MIKILLLLVFFAANSITQWQNDQRLTIDPQSSYTSYNNARCIVSNGNNVHVVWHDLRNQLSNDGNYEIYYKRSSDGGLTWGPDTRITNAFGPSSNPSITFSGSNMHIVWWESRDGNTEIYYKRSTNEGESWGNDIRLTNDAGASTYPTVASSQSNTYAVWVDNRDGNTEIYFKRSSDAGNSWGNDTRLTNNSAISGSPSIVSYNSNVHISWNDLKDTSTFEIYYKKSTDGGINWSNDKRLTYDQATSYLSSIAAFGSNVHVVWSDSRDGHSQLYYKRSIDNGDNWENDVRLTNTTVYFSLNANIIESGNNIHLVWCDDRDLNYEIYYKHSSDNGSNWSSDLRLTTHPDVSDNPFVAISGTKVHAVWRDRRNVNDEIYYKLNPTGNELGFINISSEIPSNFSLSQNYPNPFNPATKIRFSIPMDSRLHGNDRVVLIIFDVLGREVQTIVNEQLKPGIYEVDFDGSNYSSGVYYYKLTAGTYSETRKMVLIK